MVLLALGSNGSGQLGLGHVEDVQHPTRHEIPNTILKHKPVSIRAGGNHTLILAVDGALYLSGQATETEDCPLPTIAKLGQQTILIAENVRLCSATWEASIYVVDNAIYTYGRGDKGELGRTDITEPRVNLLGIADQTGHQPRIVDIASGVQHVVVVHEDGQVWGWGNGRKGQLGKDAANVEGQPRRIEEIDFKVVRAVCGREFTFLVGEPAEGRFVILGSDKWNVKSDAPAHIRGWKAIGACWSSVSVLFASGKVESWGRNDHGQLAPDGLPPINELACGSEHSLALTSEGQILAWGWGEHGNCGPDLDRNYDVKGRWSGLIVHNSQNPPMSTFVGAGCATSWIWTSEK